MLAGDPFPCPQFGVFNQRAQRVKPSADTFYDFIDLLFKLSIFQLELPQKLTLWTLPLCISKKRCGKAANFALSISANHTAIPYYVIGCVRNRQDTHTVKGTSFSNHTNYQAMNYVSYNRNIYHISNHIYMACFRNINSASNWALFWKTKGERHLFFWEGYALRKHA